MIKIAIPGYETLKLEHLVLDHNGTLACDGILIEGVKERLHKLSDHLQIHVLTADTFGKARVQLGDAPCKLSILTDAHHDSGQDIGKIKYVRELGPNLTVCIGNGRNDRYMLKHAALGIAVMLAEGVAVEALKNADVVCTDICDALDLLLNPLRLTATLRS